MVVPQCDKRGPEINRITPTTRSRRWAAVLFRGLVVSLLVGIASPRPVLAGEGGGSHYMPGVAGDFAMALIGPPG